MTSSDIITQIQTYLQNDTVLSVYIQKVYLGVRANIPDQNYPCIVIERINNVEDDEKDAGVLQRLTMKLVLSAYINVKTVDNQLIGIAPGKGTLDIEKDIKVALSAFYPNFGGNCIWFKFKQTLDDIDRWPIRGIHIEMDIYYQQNLTTRT